MDVSIVILNYKTCNLLKNCLRSIYDSKSNVNWEIIVVDNNSEDNTREILSTEFKDVRAFFCPKNIGHAGGNNIGIRNANGRYILLLNTDIVFLQNYILDEFVAFMDIQKETAIMAPKLVSPDGTIQKNCRKFPTILQPIYSRTFLGKTKKGKKFMNDFLLKNLDKDKVSPVDWVQSSCLIIRRSSLEKVGPMDELFFIYFSDVDWCKRFWREGYKILYNPEISVIHYFHRESAQHAGIEALLQPITRTHIKDWIKFILKYNSPFLNKKYTTKFLFTS